jgi:hypothetical protein
MKRIALYSAAAAFVGFAALPASAMTVAPLSTETAITPVASRLVCDRSGQCYRTARTTRRVVRRYYAEPDYYDDGPAYAYSYGPSVSFGVGGGYPYRHHYWGGGPSVGFSFGGW